MKIIVLLAFLSAGLALASAGNVVCFFLSWTIYRPDVGAFAAKDVDPTLCTHVVYSYIGLNENGTVKVLDDWDITGLMEIDHLISLKEQNPDLKVLVSMGGWGENSTTYSTVAADPDLRAVMIDSVISFMELHQFDGLDMHWEYPGQRDGDAENDPANFVTWLGELQTAFSASEYILSATVAGVIYGAQISYPDGKAVSDNVDILNVLSLDYHGNWETIAGHNAPLYPSHLDDSGSEVNNVAAGLQYWIDSGADLQKIHMAIATYGRSFTLNDPANAELYAPADVGGEAGPYTQEVGLLSYYEICNMTADWEETWDDEQMVPHRVMGDQWVGYDNEKSVQLKIEYANKLGLGGAMIWSLDTDDFLGTCGDKFPLLKVVNDNLN